MNFEDEDYRRLYVRRTVTSKRLGWEGRAVRNEMLTEFDRAGIWEFVEDAAADIAELVEMPIEVVRIGLARLLATRTWVMSGGRIVWPHYVEAQTVARSDRVRQQESRDRRREQALSDAKNSQVDQSRHAPSQTSQNVTPPSLAVPPSLPSLSSSPGGAREPEPESSPTVTEIRKLPDPAPRPPASAKGIFVPGDWAPKDAHRVRCQELRFDIDSLIRAFRNHEFNREYTDWDRRFSQWIEKEKTNRETAAAKALTAPPARAGPRRHGSAQQDHGVDPFSFHRGTKT